MLVILEMDRIGFLAASIAVSTAMILSAGPAKIDYVEIVDADSLEPVRELRGAARICVAVRIGACRLIDNIGVDAST